MKQPPRGFVIAHPSPDLYGSDLQLIESVAALVDIGQAVTVLLPSDGPLIRRLVAAGAKVKIIEFPVVRLSILHPLAFLRFTVENLIFVWRGTKLLHSLRPVAVYVNTLTIPIWGIVAKIANVGLVVHVHEAEERGPDFVRRTFFAPLLLSDRVIVNSVYSAKCLSSLYPRLGQRTDVVYNGIRERQSRKPGIRCNSAGGIDGSIRLVFVGRLSPRKGADILLQASEILVDLGRNPTVTIAGSAYAGYEAYEEYLITLSQSDKLAGRVNFCGYIDDPSELFVEGDICVVPSRLEPFGNIAVEAQLAGIPVIVSRVQGLPEIVEEAVTGYLFETDDADDLAQTIIRASSDLDKTRQIAELAQSRARLLFSAQSYKSNIQAALQVWLRTGPDEDK